MSKAHLDVFVQARFVYATLPKAERGAADLLFDEGKSAAKYTLAEYARRADSSEASVIRFCRRIGASGYADFTENLAAAEEPPDGHAVYRVSAKDDLKTVFQKIARNHADTLADTLALYTDEYDRAFDAMRRARTIHFFGVGDAQLVCQAAHMKFARIGKSSTSYSDAALMLTAASLAHADDLIVAVSFSGQSRVLTNLVQLAKANGATVVVIVHNEKSLLCRLADISLFTATTDLTPTHDEIARRIAEHAIIDTLYMALFTRDKDTYGSRGEASLAAIQAYK